MKSILVIEDDLTLRSEISTILTFEGYNVLEAENGLTGLKLALALVPDLILCDIMMPEMDGLQVLNEIKDSESTKLIPFIFLTALAERSNLRSGMEMGANDYITKPFTRVELLNAISIQLEKAMNIELTHNKEMKQLREIIISKIPHEMNTPLHSILGFSQVLSDEAGKIKPSEITKIAGYITLSGQRLLNLIKRYNYFIYLFATKSSRVPNPGQGTQTELIMNRVMASIATDYNRPDDILFSFDQGDVLLPAAEFETMLKELIDNAFKFSLPGSKVDVSSSNMDGMYTICIEDGGRGILPENIKKIGAFLQFDRDVYEQQGSGLGLVIARLIVDINGGNFHIASEPDKGTKVTVSLPNA